MSNSITVPRRKVVSFLRDLGNITWQPYYLTLECGHKTGGTHRQAHARAIECWRCYDDAVKEAARSMPQYAATAPGKP